MSVSRESRWTKREERLLRRYVAMGMLNDEIGELLERTEKAVKSRLTVLKIRRGNYHKWTDDEARTAISLQGKLSARKIAEQLGRTMSQVHQFFNRRGLSTPKDTPRLDQPEFEELPQFIRDRHAQGWTDAETVAEWNQSHPTQIDRRWLQVIRRDKLGLSHNAHSEHRRRAVGEKTKEQLQRAGLASLAELRAQRYREFARSQGWPEDMRPREVQILKLLYEKGPHTRKQIATAIGMRWIDGSKKNLAAKVTGGSYLAELQARGFVVRLGRSVKSGPRKGAHCNLYAIAPHVTRGGLV